MQPYILEETHRTLFDRVREHLDDIANSEEKNAMVKHMAKYHPDESPDFSFKLHKSWKTSLAREIGEALEITGHNSSSLMNCKSELGMNSVPRVSVNTLEGPQPSAPPASPVQPNMCQIAARVAPTNPDDSYFQGPAK